jgi:hypothetical protein
MARATLTGWGMVLAAATLLVGCGRDSEPKSYRVARRPVVSRIAPGEADLVSAVSPGGSLSPVGLKFRVPEPPRVGQPLHLELVLSQEPGLDISHILVSVQPGEGLLLESARSIEFGAPAAGATQHIQVNLRPQQEGLLSLIATVLVDTGSSSVTRSFSIPLIAEP